MPTLHRTARRAFIQDHGETGVYHVVSRVANRRFDFGEPEKEKFIQMMRSLAALCHLEILTYCVMGNHFHLLVRVPERPEGYDPDFETVLALWRDAVGPDRRKQMEQFFDHWRNENSGQKIEEWRTGVVQRMFHLSEFMKLLKHRFSHWFNNRHKRTGPFWDTRYISVAVADEERDLRIMATYIDLNPVRAGIVQHPADYPWCGYSEALSKAAAQTV